MSDALTNSVALLPVDDERVETLRVLRNGFLGTGLLRHELVVDAAAQRQWWRGLDKDRNRYFLVAEGRRILGFVSAVQSSRQDVENQTAEVGVMLPCGPGDQRAHAAFHALLVHCFTDWGLAKLRFAYPRCEGGIAWLVDGEGFREAGAEGAMVIAELDRADFGNAPPRPVPSQPPERQRILVFVAKWIGKLCLDHVLAEFPNDEYDIVVGAPEQEEICQALTTRGIAFTRLCPETIARIESQPEQHYDWLLNLWGGHIFKRPILSRAGRSLNMHPSYLPFCRGRDPVVWAIRYGYPAGATLHAITEGVDEGPIWYRERVDYTLPAQGGPLYDRVVERSWKSFCEQWADLRGSNRQPWPQPSETPTYRRAHLLADRDADFEALAGESGQDLLRRLLAHDFGPGYSARLRIGGELFNARLVLSPAERDEG